MQADIVSRLGSDSNCYRNRSYKFHTSLIRAGSQFEKKKSTF